MIRPAIQTPLFGAPRLKRRPATSEERFRLWASANEQVIQLFLRFAREARASGRKKFGIKAIAERARWEHLVVRKEADPYAVNNDYMSRLARLLIERDPSLEGFFEFRRLRS